MNGRLGSDDAIFSPLQNDRNQSLLPLSMALPADS